ncbi:MAG: hypothetical protein Q9160_003611 [Pyrenula sp. 1 TL-2023]
MKDSGWDKDFLDASILDTVVPEETQGNLDHGLRSALEDGSINVLQRSTLFFDENVPVYIKLRVREKEEVELRERLLRLEVGLDVYASNDNNNNGPRSPAEVSESSRDLVFSTQIASEPHLITSTEDGDTLALWKVNAMLHRPRMRFPSPVVSFVAHAALSPPKEHFSDSDDDLQSFVPPAQNLLAPLGYGELDGATSTADTFAPRIPAHGPQRIRHEPARWIRIVLAANARIRYSRLNTFQKRPTTVASLDFEVTSFLSHKLELTDALLALSDGRVEDLTNLENPIQCRPRDTVTFMYKLYPSHGTDSPSPSTTSTPGTILISLTAQIHVSSTCRATIHLNWTTHVDFSTPVNPVFGAPSQAMQRSNRPMSLPVRSRSGSNQTGRSLTSKPSWHDAALVVSFSGPSTVEVGKPFPWEVFIVNRGSKPQKLVLAVIPSRRRAELNRHAARSSTATMGTSGSMRDSGLSTTPRRAREDVAPAVVDENILLAMQRSAGVGSAGTDLVCLTPDARIGPLPPGSCHITELKLLPLTPGPLRLEVVRIVDIATGEATDVRDLPDIVAVESMGG